MGWLMYEPTVYLFSFTTVPAVYYRGDLGPYEIHNKHAHKDMRSLDAKQNINLHPKIEAYSAFCKDTLGSIIIFW